MKIYIAILVLILGTVLINSCSDDDNTSLSAGATLSYTLPNSISFNMKYVPGGFSFRTHTEDRTTDPVAMSSVSNAYWIAETEVTYKLWNAVYQWAVNGTGGAPGEGQYTFVNTGTMGDGSGDTDLHPVTTINWRESVVWCNALTEYYNANNGSAPDLDLVYYSDTNYQTPLRTATDAGTIDLNAGSEDNPFIKSTTAGNTNIINCTATGFRLPGLAEWSCAGRYQGSYSNTGAYEYPASSGQYWTPGTTASGDSAPYTTSTTASNYAVYDLNSGSSSAEVMSLGIGSRNALGLYDMSGNVQEWNHAWHYLNTGTSRVVRGGSWGQTSQFLQVGVWIFYSPDYEASHVGFRITRSQ